MQQRRLRLGDILDDYCPRERRITNHVVVAMIDDDVKQTRCTTCDAEHEYKQAKAPAPRRKKTGALTPEGGGEARPRAVHAPLPPPDTESSDTPDDVDLEADIPSTVDESQAEAGFSASAADGAVEDVELPDDDVREDDGPVHRRLIRATLPRPEGQAPERREPEFTMRQPAHNKRGRGHRGAREAQGQQGGHNRFGGQRQGAGASRHGSGSPQGQGSRHGNRPGQSNRSSAGRPGTQNRGPGRKRGR